MKKLRYVHNSMIQRCYNPNNPNYKYYGAKGIAVCDEWRNSKDSFVNWALANGYEEGLDLDKDILSRKLGIGPAIYSPDTCCFVSRRDNQECKESSRYITYKGEKKTISQWARRLGVRQKTLAYRLELGWSDKKTIETKIGEIKPLAKAIEQYSMDGEFIKEYESAREADRQTGVPYKNISVNLRGITKSSGGFIWKYKIENKEGLLHELT